MFRRGTLYKNDSNVINLPDIDEHNKSLANLVVNDEDASRNEINISDDSNSFSDYPITKSVRSKSCLMVILVSWIAIASVTGVLAIVWRKEDEDTPSPSKAPTSSPTISPSLFKSLSPSMFMSFQQEVSAAITPLYPDSPSPLEDSSSPQSKALTWMIYNNQIKPNQLQRYYIAVLYFAMEGNTWNNKDDWMIDNVPECIWYGVECDDDNLFAVELRLSANGVRGTIPREIALLDMLKEIKMENNGISGIIPSAITSLTSLSILSLHSNYFEGEIPSEIGKLGALQYLYLDQNNINGAVPDSLWSLSALVELTLNSNNLGGSIAKELNNLSMLERFWISNNRFTGNIPNATKSMPNIKSYYIDINEFKGTIPENFAELMPNLRDIRMSNNILGGCLPKNIFSMKSLEILYLDNNEFQCELFPEIYSAPSLSDLQIQNNGFYGNIPDVSISFYLKILDLSQNKFSSTIPTTLIYLTSLKLLSLAENNLTGTIPEVFGRVLYNIEYLRLNNNALIGTIPTDLGDLDELQELLLDANELNGSMPAEICEIQATNSAIITADCTGENTLVSCDCCNNCLS